MPRKQDRSLQRIAEERRDAVARVSARWVDLQLDLVDERTGERVIRFGGRWDRSEKAYEDDDAPTSRVIPIHPGQIEPAKWFDAWISHHLAGDLEPADMVFDALLAGGRRGGKTALAMLEAVGYAVTVPSSIVWVVCPSDAYYGEPITYLEDIMPPEWYQSLGAPTWTYHLANGSQIVIRSGFTPRKLKQGKADFIVIQEGQAMNGASYNTLSASIVDSGGLVVTTANPPDIGDPGTWVADLASSAQTKRNPHARFFFFDPELNPHIDQSALRALALKYDQHTYDVQVRGMFLLAPDAVLHAWDQRENEIPTPQIGKDITRRFTKFFEGTEYDDIVGVDVQNYPWIAGVRMRAFENPEAPDDMEQAFLWGVGEVYLEKGDELEFAHALTTPHQFAKSLGPCDPDQTLVICDASGRWQQQKRKENEQRVEFRGKGKGSFDLLHAGGFRSVVPPDQRMEANPDVVERCRAANARIAQAIPIMTIDDEALPPTSSRRFVFVDPDECPNTVKSIRQWKTGPSGQPSRHSRSAHGGDAFTYIIWRFFPRRDERRNVEIRTGFGKRFEGRDRTKGW